MRKKTFSMNRGELLMGFFGKYADEKISKEKILFYGKNKNLAIMLICNEYTNNEIELQIGKVSKKGFVPMQYIESTARAFGSAVYTNLTDKQIVNTINRFYNESGKQFKKLPKPSFNGFNNNAF